MKFLYQTKREGLVLLGVLLLGLVPLPWFISQIDLTSPVSALLGQSYTWLTDSAGTKGFLITLSVLLALSWKSKGSPSQAVAKLIQLGIILLIGFSAKTGLKHMTESPRPYTELFATQLLVPQPSHFYKLDSAQKASVIEAISAQVSDWRTRHWQGEKDYSFPSGHTIFASICLAFFGGLFWQDKRYGLVALVGIWALAVAYSRVWLGMHRPIDLVGSIVFVGGVFLVLQNLDKRVETVLDKLKHSNLHSNSA